MKKGMTWMLIVVLLLSMAAGCSGETQQEGSKTEGSKAQQASREEQSGPVEDKPIALSFLCQINVDTEGYDVIKGWRANASYFYIAKEFVRDNIDMDILTELLSLGGLGIQYCIKSRLAYEHLQEVQDGLLSVDYMEFREKYNQRDVSARQKMRELIDSDANKVTNVFSTLL